MIALLVLAACSSSQRGLDLIVPDRFDLRYGFGDEDFDTTCGMVDGDSSWLEFGLSWDLFPRERALTRADVFWALQEDRRASAPPPPPVIEPPPPAPPPTPPLEEEEAGLSPAATTTAVGGLSGVAGMALGRFGPELVTLLRSRARRRLERLQGQGIESLRRAGVDSLRHVIDRQRPGTGAEPERRSDAAPRGPEM